MRNSLLPWLRCSWFHQWPERASGSALHCNSRDRWGEAYVIESTSNLTSQIWQPRAALTTDAAMAVWADDGAPRQAMFYRVHLATNPRGFSNRRSDVGCRFIRA